MPPNLLKYSNGWGHLIMSIVLIVAGVILILQPSATVQAVGIGLVGTVVPYWFISSSANAQRQATAQINVNPTPITITPSQSANTASTPVSTPTSTPEAG